MDRFSRLDAILTVVALLIAASALYFYFSASPSEKSQGTLTKAAPGTLVSSFPQGLITEPGITPTESYELSSGGGTLEVASYISQYPLDENVEMFKNYFTSNGWAIIRLPSVSDAVSSLYAVKGGLEANITFSKENDGLKIIISIKTS